jgi:hypothetical protein
MENYLPIVDPEVGHSVSEMWGDDETDEEVYARELEMLKIVNPTIAEFIELWCKRAATDEQMHHSAFCGILVYKLLASQAEVDQMEKEIRL